MFISILYLHEYFLAKLLKHQCNVVEKKIYRFVQIELKKLVCKKNKNKQDLKAFLLMSTTHNQVYIMGDRHTSLVFFHQQAEQFGKQDHFYSGVPESTSESVQCLFSVCVCVGVDQKKMFHASSARRLCLLTCTQSGRMYGCMYGCLSRLLVSDPSARGLVDHKKGIQ